MRRSLSLPFALLFTASCAQPGRVSAPTTAPAGSAAQQPPATAPARTPELPGVHNVHRAAGGVYSGGVPDGDPGFDTLRALGIRTVISVDGARPDVAAAETRGMRYVHLPIGYDGIPTERRPHLLRALRDLPEPIFIHCHHGRHRSPAAAAFALVTLGRLTPEQGVAFLKQAGTSPHYAGLYRCVEAARPVDPAWLAALKPDFPAVARLPSFVAAMSQLDATWERIGLIAGANWATPPDHPDLVPHAEAVILAEAFRELLRDERMRVEPADFATRMRASEEDAWSLADAIRAGDAAGAAQRYARLEADCRSCHQIYRDQSRVRNADPPWPHVVTATGGFWFAAAAPRSRDSSARTMSSASAQALAISRTTPTICSSGPPAARAAASTR